MNDNDTLADDLRKDSLALMKLLADEKHKSEALAAEMANEQKDRANADKVGLQYLSRIRALEAALREIERCYDGLDLVEQRMLVIAQRALATAETATTFLEDVMEHDSQSETACEHEWETLGIPEGAIRCVKCDKHDSSL